MWGLVQLTFLFFTTSLADQVVYSAKEYIGENPYQSYVSRPDIWPPEAFINITASDAVAPGYIFLAQWGGTIQQPGPVIMDNDGHLIWAGAGDAPQTAMNFRVQQYKGKKVLTYYTGVVSVFGEGQGSYFILDDTYSTIATVKAGNHEFGDLHEFFITDSDTAIMTTYTHQPADLTEFNVSGTGWISNCGFQEVAIDTGEVLFEWKAYPHVNLSDSYALPIVTMGNTSVQSWDFFHINCIEKDDQGNYLVSSRHYCALYYIDGQTGDILWQLNGKKSDFTMGPKTRFAYQHFAQFQSGNRITLFDDGSDGIPSHPLPTNATESRGVILNVDYQNMSVTLGQEFFSPNHVFTGSQGDLQLLSNGNSFIGWGLPYFGEWAPNGDCLFYVQFGNASYSYRVFREEWTGYPKEPPAIYAEGTTQGQNVTVYVSWNGATEVKTWEIQGRTTASGANTTLATVPKNGFETAVSVKDMPFLVVHGLDVNGTVLGSSAVVQPSFFPFSLASV